MSLPDAQPPQDRAPAAARAPGSLRAPLLASAITLVAVTAASAAPLGDYVATVVGGCFLVATWWLVLRHDDATVRAYGLSLGGLLEPPRGGEGDAPEPPAPEGPRLDLRRLFRDALVASGWALLFMAVFFPIFLIGYRVYWRPPWPFHLRFPPSPLGYVAGQLVVIALPEEAFFRGYLQTSFNRVWPPRLRILGADVGPGLIAASAIFAAGHMLTIHRPERLAVFFPALVFGWLRARTGGIGAGLLFHAACNIFSETLGRSFGLIH